MLENIPNPQKTKVEEIRDFSNRSLEEGETVEDMTRLSEARKVIGAEISSLYTKDVLERSRAWHAFAGSSIKENEEDLPVTVENGIAEVLSNLIERNLRPLLR